MGARKKPCAPAGPGEGPLVCPNSSLSDERLGQPGAVGGPPAPVGAGDSTGGSAGRRPPCPVAALAGDQHRCAGRGHNRGPSRPRGAHGRDSGQRNGGQRPAATSRAPTFPSAGPRASVTVTSSSSGSMGLAGSSSARPSWRPAAWRRSGVGGDQQHGRSGESLRISPKAVDGRSGRGRRTSNRTMSGGCGGCAPARPRPSGLPPGPGSRATRRITLPAAAAATPASSTTRIVRCLSAMNPAEPEDRAATGRGA